MAITALPPAPSSGTPSVFAAEADAFLGALPAFGVELNDLATALNFLDTTTTSADTETISSSATVVFTVEAGKSFLKGMTLKCAYTTTPSTWMLGEVLSYTGTTLTVAMRASNGSGALAGWTITLSPVTIPAITQNQVSVVTGNGHGSANTRIRRFTTLEIDIGDSRPTYVDSETDGGSFTITASGLYSISYYDFSSSAVIIGVSVNSTQLSTSIATITSIDRLYQGKAAAGGGDYALCSGVNWFDSGDVVRAHTDGGTNGATVGNTKFSITRLS